MHSLKVSTSEKQANTYQSQDKESLESLVLDTLRSICVFQSDHTLFWCLIFSDGLRRSCASVEQENPQRQKLTLSNKAMIGKI